MAVHTKIKGRAMVFLLTALVPLALGVGGVGVGHFLPVMANAAEDTARDPSLSCHLGGFPRLATKNADSREEFFEEGPDGTFATSNLTALTLQVRLEGGGLPVQQLERMHSESRPPPPWEDTKRATVEVTIDSLSDHETNIAFPIGSSGSGGSRPNAAYLRLHFRLPIDAVEQRKQGEEYYRRLVNSSDLKDPNLKRLLEDEENIVRILSTLAALQNKVGTYKISCAYSSEKEPWIGTVHAEPLILKINFAKNFLDQDHFDPGGDKD